MNGDDSLLSPAEEIAHRYAATRPGFRLADYAEVGLPIYRLTVEAFFLARKQIPPIEEFILRAMGTGIRSAADISGLLGIDLPLVNDGMATLVQTDDIYLAASPDSKMQTLTLTQKGMQTLREARLLVPEERIIQVDFDGLCRSPIALQGWLLKPRELREAGIREIPPVTTKKPDVEDLRVADVVKAVRQMGGMLDVARELLSFKAIERRDSFFLPAVALIYKAKVGDDIQVAFAIDGRLSRDHEEAFARANGPKKMKIVESLAQKDPVVVEEVLSAGTDVAVVPEQELEALKRASSAAQLDVDEARRAAEQAASELEHRQAQEKLSAAADNLQQVDSALAAIPVRGLEVYEHPPLLERALRESKERLLIISPWIRAKVVNRSFIFELERTLRRNVKVFIGYGLGEYDDEARDNDRRAEQDLQRLADRYANFLFVRLGDTHAKVLVCDRAFMVTTSFNWLSYRGDPNRTFRDEQGMYVGIPEVIEERFQRLLARLTAPDPS